MKDNSKGRIVRILGLGLDNDDHHVRVTQGDNFSIFLGSESTHEHLQETCMKFNEKLERRGKRMEELSTEEVIDLMTEAESS